MTSYRCLIHSKKGTDLQSLQFSYPVIVQLAKNREVTALPPMLTKPRISGKRISCYSILLFTRRYFSPQKDLFTFFLELRSILASIATYCQVYAENLPLFLLLLSPPKYIYICKYV